MSEVVLDRITKTYPNGVTAVSELSLEIADGEFLVLVGPSGCGKSTALRMIAGLEDITSGELRIRDIVVNNVAPKDRDIAMVFQNYALYPHMTVRDNIAFALKLAKVSRTEIDARVSEAARVLELTSYLDRKPAHLSGGQRQRVAMGRAIVRRPAAFLMDEPLSNLDAKLRVQTRAEIARIQDDLGVTTVYVTHDQVEAMTMADRVAILNFGILQQVDTPERVYDHPNNAFVAAFIGSPAMNLVEGDLRAGGDGLEVALGEQTLSVPASLRAARPGLSGYAGKRVIVGIRPEDLEDSALVNGGRPTLRAPVQLIESLGAERMVHLSFGAPPARVADPDQLEGIGLVAGDHDANSMLVGRFSPQSRVRQGESIDVAVDAERLHFFDIETGEAIWS